MTPLTIVSNLRTFAVMKTLRYRLPVFALIALLLPAIADARTWTSTQGQELEAEFVSTDGTSVVLRRTTDKQEFTLALSRLSAADQTWIKENAAKKPAPSSPTGSGTAKPITGPYAKLITGDWALSEHGDLPFALYGAKELSADQKVPLVVSLHGKSDNNENGKQIGFARTFTKPEFYAKRPCVVVAPLCYQPYGGTGGGWSDKPGEEAIELVKELVENLPIDEERIYCVGYSMGGFGTCHLIAQETRLFTAGVPIAGYGSGGDVGELKRTPIWLFHAADDPVVNVEGSRTMADTLKRSKDFKYTEFETGGHGISGQVMSDEKVHEWLFAQKK